MDAASRALCRAKEEILSSWEWVEMKQELLRQQESALQKSAGKDIEISFPFDANQIQNTAAYKRLQARVSRTLAENFVSSSPWQHHSQQHPLSSSAVGRHFETVAAVSRQMLPDESSSHVRKACAYLLEGAPHLKHHLKKHFNHPLPREIRPTAWKVLLTDSDTSATRVGSERYLHQHIADETRISQKCEAVLKSSRVFIPVAHSTVLQKAMQDIVLCWLFRTRSGSVLERDLLLSIPFLYAWKEKLQSSSSAIGDTRAKFPHTQPDPVVKEMSSVYCCFMENLPHTMDSTCTNESSKATDVAINQFSLQVEGLLYSGVPKLYRHLTTLFSKSAVEGGKELPFHVHLRDIVQPSVQKMLVGDLSLDVVCYIWDQCFIGRQVSGFQCLAYYITVWFILLKHQLEHCHSIEAVTKVFTTMSNKLTVAQFQVELEKRYLHKLCTDLGVVPHMVLVHSGMHLLEPVQSRPKSSPMKRLNTHTRRQETPPPQMNLQAVSIHETKEFDAEKEQLRKSVAVLRKNLEEERKKLSDLLKQEKEHHRKDVERLTAEISALKKKVASNKQHHPQQIGQSYERPRKTDAPVATSAMLTPSSIHTCRTETFSSSTVETVLSPLSSTLSGSTLTGMSGIQRLFTEAATPLSQSSLTPSEATSFHSQPGLPWSKHLSTTLKRSKHSTPDKEESQSHTYSPNRVSEKDAIDIWLKILSRFRDGVYLVCHGSEKEKQLLLKNMKQEKDELIINS